MKSDEPPSSIQSKPRFLGEDDFGVHWENNDYYGCLRRFKKGCSIGNGPYAILSITSKDETSKHDFRDFQQLKNLILGEEWWAVEFYPAESSLIDPSNRFYLWCTPTNVFKCNLDKDGHRNVLTSEQSGAPQRMFPQELGVSATDVVGNRSQSSC